jgi:hypothetical protein
MKTLIKGIIIASMSVFLLTATYAKTPKIEKTPKTETKVTCDKKPGVEQKMVNVKKSANEKISMINNVLASISKIIPLVTDSTIKTQLQQAKESLQITKNKYTSVVYRINTDPKSMCWVGPILKPYNEETKKTIKDVRKILNILKK